MAHVTTRVRQLSGLGFGRYEAGYVRANARVLFLRGFDLPPHAAANFLVGHTHESIFFTVPMLLETLIDVVHLFA